MTSKPRRIRHFIEAHKTSVISFSSVFLLLSAPKKKIMEATGMNKESGPAKPWCSHQYPPFADSNSLIFRHFSRYLCRPMLKLMKKLRDGGVRWNDQVIAHLDYPSLIGRMLPSKKEIK